MSPGGNHENPRLSMIVIAYNMRREIPRTLFSLSTGFQRGIEDEDYEVIVVENGSPDPLTAEEVEAYGPNFRYHFVEDASPSPASAINIGARLARGANLGIMIDGARLCTPGMLRVALEALDAFDRAVVGTVSFHLGPDDQSVSIMDGYNRDVEDELLRKVRWRNWGYRLFEIGTPAGTTISAGLGRMGESNLVFLSTELFDELGGFDERFDLPGGGIVNLDFYKRCCELSNSTAVTLLGEGTFHQFHGGEMSSRPDPDRQAEAEKYRQQYVQIHGREFRVADVMPILFALPRPEFQAGVMYMSRIYVKREPNKIERRLKDGRV